jgi:hypothetical protein
MNVSNWLLNLNYLGEIRSPQFLINIWYLEFHMRIRIRIRIDSKQILCPDPSVRPVPVTVIVIVDLGPDPYKVRNSCIRIRVK